MTIVRKFTTQNSNGEVVTISEWANTLSPEDKALYEAASARQEAIHRSLVEARKISLTGNGIVFLGDEPLSDSEMLDEEWKSFFGRYLDETGQSFERTDEKL